MTTIWILKNNYKTFLMNFLILIYALQIKRVVMGSKNEPKIANICV